MSCTHRLDSVCDESAKGSRKCNRDVKHGDSFSLGRRRVDLRDDKGERRKQAGLKESKENSAGDDLTIAMNEAGTNSDATPAYNRNGKNATRAEFLDGKNPGCFEYDVGDVEIHRNIVELSSCHSCIFFKAKDSCISWGTGLALASGCRGWDKCSPMFVLSRYAKRTKMAICGITNLSNLDRTLRWASLLTRLVSPVWWSDGTSKPGFFSEASIVSGFSDDEMG